MKYIVYQTTNLINNKIYIGQHKTKDPNIFDQYLGCGIKVNMPSSYENPCSPLQYAVKKDGSIAKQPSKDKIFEDGMIYFSTNLNQNIDFIEEIEKHSPLKVEIDNTNF